jgi:archaeosortase B (VPXXXP-CTERM-specific)
MSKKSKKRRKKEIKAETHKWFEDKEVIRFISLFIISSIVLFSIYYLLKDTILVTGLRSTTATITGTLLSISGMNAETDGQIIFLNGFSMEIIDECTAIYSSIVFASCVAAFPTTLRNKGNGIAAGVPLLYAIDIVRLYFLGIVGVKYPSMFEFVHVYFWQATFIIFVVAVFFVWLKVIKEVEGIGRSG